jgi:uncharacterized protein
VLFFCACVILGLFLSAFVYAALGRPRGAMGTVENLPVIAAYELATAIAIVVAAIVFRRFVDRRSIASLGFAFRAGWLRLVCIGAAFGAGMQCLVFAIEAGTGSSRIAGFAGAASDLRVVAAYLPFFIIAALNEEMMIRGYAFQNLWEEFRLPAAVVISAALFAAIHLGNPNSHADLTLTLAGLVAFGIWACASYVWTKSLWLALGVHFAWNLFEGPVFGFPVSGLAFQATAIRQTFVGPEWLTGGPFGPESGASSLLALAAGLGCLYWLYKRGVFSADDDPREAYAR